jgi:pimeloyl-ACP methyl ester carboxylesterase
MDLHIWESGELNAPALVFLHGGGVAGWMWKGQADFFKDYHVIIPDLPGHGKSSDVPFISINDAASKVLAAVMDIVGNERISLVGFSLGAQLAVEIISRWPEKVDSALISSALVRPFGSGKNLLLSILKMSFGLARIKWFSRLQAGQLCIPRDMWDLYYQDSAGISKDNFVRMMEANMSYALPESFAKSDVRTLVLAGEKENRIIRDSAADMVQANRNCTGYLVLGSGHGIVLAEPDFFDEIIRSFLDNIQLHRNSRLERIVRQ